MGAYLAKAGKKVLLVDLDPQGNATTGLGFEKASIKSSVYNAMIENANLNNCIVNSNIPNLDLLPSSIDLAGAEVELVYIKQREYVLSSILKPIQNVYDFILIDCPPSLGLLTINALTAADSCIIPIQSEYYALEGLSQLLNSIKLVTKHLNPKLKIEGVVLTMYDNRALISRQIAEEIRRFFKAKVYGVIIPRNIRVSEAPSHGVPVMLHDAKCSGARAYQALTEEFLNRQEE